MSPRNSCIRFLFWTALASAACGEPLPHDAPFDPQSPPEKQAKAALRGTFVLENETDHSQVAIELQSDARTYTVLTKSDGSFELNGVVPGTYVLTAGTRYFQPVTEAVTFEAGALRELPARAIAARRAPVKGSALLEAKNGSFGGGVRVVLTRTGSLRGAQGAPAYRAAAGEATGETLTYQTISGSDGGYEFSDVPAGTYEAVASEPGVATSAPATVTVTGEDGAATVAALVVSPMFGYVSITGKSAAGAVSSTTVTLELDPSGSPVEAEIAFDPDFLTAERFAFTRFHAATFAAGDGFKTVYARFYDGEGNVSSVGSDSAWLDSLAPENPAFTIREATPSNAAALNLDHTAVGAVQMAVAQSAACDNSWEPYVPASVLTHGLAAEGTVAVSVRFRDEAGNATACLTRSVYYDATPPAPGVNPVLLNFGDPETSSAIVQVSLNAAGATQVKLSEDSGLADAAWVPYSATRTLALSNANGSKTVYALFRDDAGNTAGPVNDSIVLDTSPIVTPYVTIQADATSATTVLVNLAASNVAQMLLSESADFAGAQWQPYVGVTAVTFTGGDGTKALYAKFRKASGAESSVASDSYILDRAGPVLPSLRINNGAVVVDDEIVSLSLSAVDSVSGLSIYRISETGSFGAQTDRTYQPNDVYTLPGTDGAKTVWAIYRDRAGNYSAAVSAAVLLDRSAPVATTASLSLLDGTTVSNGATVKEGRLLLASAVSDLSALEMQVTTNGSFTGVGWEPYNAVKVIDITAAVNTVQARVRDAAGHTVDLLGAVIVNLDTTAPVGTVTRTSATPTNNPTVSLSLGADETSLAQVSENPGFAGAVWFATAATTFTLAPGDGLRTIYARFRDAAGNLSAIQAVQVLLDQTGPQLASFSIDQGVRTNAPGITLTYQGIDITEVRVAEGASCAGSYGTHAGTGSLTLSAGDGTKWVSVQFRDAVGNTSACLTRAIELDLSPPVVTLVELAGGEPYTTAQAVALALAVTGAAEMQLSESSSFSGASWTPFTTATTLLLSTGDGPKTVYARFRDLTGNTATGADGLVLDTTPPVVTLAVPVLVTTATVGLSANVSETGLTLTLAEDAGFTSNVVTRGFAGLTTGVTYALLSAADGARSIYARVRDPAGNLSATLQSAVRVDSTPPALPQLVINSGAAYTSSGVLSLQLSAIESGSGLAAYRIREQGAQPTEGEWAATTLRTYQPTDVYSLASNTEALHTLWVRFYDAAGNRSDDVSAAISLLTSAPAYAADLRKLDGSIVGAVTNQQTLLLSSSVTSTATVELMVSDGYGSYTGRSWETWAPSRTVLLPAPAGTAPESRTVRAKVRTPLGTDYEILNRTFDLDLSPPSGNLSSAAVTGSTSIAVTLLASETGVTAELAEDPSFTAGLVTVSFPTLLRNASFVFSSLTEGDHTIYYRFVDPAGNASPAAVRNVYIDITKPEVVAASVAEGLVVSSRTVTANIVALEATEIRIAENACTSGSWTAYSASATYPVAITTAGDGLKTIRYRLRDAVGNTTGCRNLYVTLDTTAPAGSLASGIGTLVSSNLIPLVLTADADVTEVRLSNESSFAASAWEPFRNTTLWELANVEGPVTVYAQFRDAVANESPVYPLAVTIDSTPPVATSILGRMVSTRLVWDHLAPPGAVTSYSVLRMENGAVASSAITTATEYGVGAVHPGYVVRANFASGRQSDPSYYVGLKIGSLPSAYVALRMNAADNAIAARFIANYGLGTTTETPCGGQLSLSYTYSTECPDTPRLAFLAATSNPYGFTPPPYFATVNAVAGNPYVGLALKVSGWPVSNNYSAVKYLGQPAGLTWNTGNTYNSFAALNFIGASVFDPNGATGANVIRVETVLPALARYDDLTYNTVISPLTANACCTSGDVTYFPSPGTVAGTWVTSVAVRVGPTYSLPYLHFNPTVPASEYLSNYEIIPRMLAAEYESPGIYRQYTPTTTRMGTVRSGQGGSTRYRSVTVEYATGNVVFEDEGSTSDTRYASKGLLITNADASRFYRIPMWYGKKTTLNWRNEYDQPAFAAFLERSVEKLASPIRVRGEGPPVVRFDVSGASEMQVSADAGFTGAVWVDYQNAVTLAEGTTVVWVRFRDDAGNVTAAQQVVIPPAGAAPLLTRVDVAGEGALPGYSTSRYVTATPIGTFDATTRIRYSTTPVFADDGWQPLTGGTLAMTLPAAAGSYTYWFWLADASNNYSQPVSATVLYDESPPNDAEFSVLPAAGAVKIQTRWTVSLSGAQPDATAGTIASGTRTLPFSFPVPFGPPESSVRISGSCLMLDAFDACALASMPSSVAAREVSSADAYTVVFTSADGFGTPVTSGVSLYPDGRIALHYWKTSAKWSMYGHVNDVPTPYADWGYQLVSGSVNYVPNPVDIVFRIESSNGTTLEVPWLDCTAGMGFNCQPWTTFAIPDFGYTTFTGTAYSAAGAVGRTSSRGVVIPRSAPQVTGSLAVGYTAVRSRVDIEGTNDLALRVYRLPYNSSGVPRIAGEGTAAVGRRGTSGSVLLNALPAYPVANMRTVYLPSYLTAKPGMALATSGVPVAADTRSNLLYGADGSIWDIGDRERPLPVRTFGGLWTDPKARAVRWRNELWTQDGIWDISKPATPVYVSTATSTTSALMAAYRGRIYVVMGGALKVFDAASKLLINTLTPGVTLKGPIVQVGRYLYIGTGTQYLRYDLSNPDNPGGTLNTTSAWFAVSNGTVLGSATPILAEGPFRLLVTGLFTQPKIQEFATTKADTGNNTYTGETRSLHGGESVSYAVAQDQMVPVRSSRSWPGRYKSLSLKAIVGATSIPAPSIVSDARHVYACVVDSSNAAAKLLVFNGTSMALLAVNDLSGTSCYLYPPAYPYLYVLAGSTYRLTLEGPTVVSEELLSDLDAAGAGYRHPSDSGTWYPTPYQAAYFELDTCRAITTDEDRILCTDAAADKTYVTTMTTLGYAGIIGETVPLPVVEISAMGSSATPLSAREGYVANPTGVYRMSGLKATMLTNASYNSMLPGELSYRNTSNTSTVRKLTAAGQTQAGLLPFNLATISPGGVAVGYDSDYSLVYTDWGPGMPEYRMQWTGLTGTRNVVSAGGYAWYAAGSLGLARIKPVEQIALMSASAWGLVHDGTGWTQLDENLVQVKTVTTATSTTMSAFCTASFLCGTALAGALTEHAFEGDLGYRIWGIRGYDTWTAASIFVADVAVDDVGVVYAAVPTHSTSPGIHIFNQTGDAVAAAPASALTLTPAASAYDLDVDMGRLFALEAGGRIEAFDLATNGVLWSRTYLTPLRIRAAGGYLSYDTSTRIYLADPATGNGIGAGCAITHADYELTVRMRGAMLRPLAIVGNGSTVTLLWLDDCSTVASWTPVSGVTIDSVGYAAGAAVIGMGSNGLAVISLANLPDLGVVTRLAGKANTSRAALLGKYLYTTGTGSAQVFELH